MLDKLQEEIERALAFYPEDEEFARADTVPGQAYELGRKDGLRVALYLLQILNVDIQRWK